MFIELAKFVALLLSILSLDAVLHTAFLEPGRTLRQQLLPSLELLLLAAGIALASGFLFSLGERTAGNRELPVVRTLPMKIFWWGSGLIGLLFLAVWYVERFVLDSWS